MPRTTFSRPFTVLVGLGFPHPVRDVMDALRLLDEQPWGLRDEAFHAAYDTCRDALRGHADADEARDVCCAFARRRGMLVDEPSAEMALVAEAAGVHGRRPDLG